MNAIFHMFEFPSAAIENMKFYIVDKFVSETIMY